MALLPDQKFSTFAVGGDLRNGDIIVGLRGGINTQFSWTLPAAVHTITGTQYQVLVNNSFAVPVSGDVILTLPQDIAPTSSPTFNGLTLTTPLSGASGGTGQANTGLSINLSGGATGKLLTSDSSGNATWQTPAYLTGAVLLSPSGDQTITSHNLILANGYVSNPLGGFYSGSPSGGFEGQFTAFSPTANMGSLTLIISDNSGNFTNELTNRPTTASRSWALPDASGIIALAGSSAETFNGDSGSAAPSAGVITFTGSTTGLTFAGSGSTMTLGGILSGAHGGTGVANTGLTINLSGGSSGLVLTSDVSGNASWASPPSGVATVSGTVNRITSTGGSNPVIDISGSYIGQSSITTLGTVTTGTWNATPIDLASYVSGNLAISHLNSGTGASNTTFWRGDGTWGTPAGAGVATVSGTTNRITSTGGANPVIDIAATYVGQSSITTLGTISTGIWQGTLVSPAFGGTGVNNSTNTLTVSANSAINQDVTTAGSPSFTAVTAGNLNLAANTLSSVNTNGNLFLNTNGHGAYIIGNSTGTNPIGGFGSLIYLGIPGTSCEYDQIFYANNANGPLSNYYKTRSTTIGSSVAVQSGDLLSRFNFLGDDGSNFTIGGSIEFFATGTISSGIIPGMMTILTANSSGTNTAALTIDSSQNITLNNSSSALNVGNLSLAGNTLSSTNTNGDISIIPNGTGILSIGFSPAPHNNLLPCQSISTTGNGGYAAYSYVNNAVNGALFDGFRSRSGVPGVFVPVQSGDLLGIIQFFGDDGTRMIEGARMRYVVDGAVSTNIVPCRQEFITCNSSGTLVRALTIDSAQIATFANPLASPGAIFTKVNGTEAANAVTANGYAGVITTSSLTTVAGSSYVITWTNSVVTTTSNIVLSIQGGTNTIASITYSCVPGSGSATLTINNINPLLALNGTLLIGYMVY